MSTISASTTSNTAFKVTSDTTGTLVLQTGAVPTTAISIDASQVVSIGSIAVTGVTTFSAGSAAAPSITTTGDTNTGIFFPAADTIGFSEGGVESLRITSAGDVGIGTASPASKLTVSGDVQILSTNYLNFTNTAQQTYIRAPASNTMAFGTSNTERMRLDSSGNLGLGVTPSAWDTSASKALQLTGGSIWAYSTSQLNLIQNAFYNTSGNLVYTNTAAASSYRQISGVHSWNTAASGTAGNTATFTQAMTLDASGNLGIGTTSPSGRLHLYQTAGGSNTLTLDTNFGSGNAFALNPFITGVSNGGFSIRDVSNGTDRIVIQYSTGNVGIGTTSPRGRLDVTGDIYQAWIDPGSYFNGMAYIDGSAYRNGLVLSGSNRSTGIVSKSADNTGFIWFGTGSSESERMRITAAGELLLGASSQFNAGKQCIAFNGSTYYGISLKDTVDQTTARFIGFINGSGTVIGSIDRVTTTNAVVYNTTSDYRLKTVIGAVANAGQRIDALQPVEYKWNSNGERARGFLAHQFQEVYANSVSGTKDAVDAEGKPVHQSMQASTSEVIADLVAELQSVRARLAALESK